MNIKYLSIASMGRSGSTLLGMALNTLPSFFYGGEIYSLWSEDGDDALCSCGESLTDCPLWRKAAANALAAAGLNSGAEARRLRDRTARLSTMAIRPVSSVARTRAAAYSQLGSGLCGALAEETDARVIVDSSKLAAHALLLAEIPGVDARIVHLVRDPRAVVYSWSVARTWPTRTGGKVRQKAAFTAILEWLSYNLKLAAALRLSGVPSLLIRYEDLVDDPISALSQIAAFVGETSALGNEARTFDVTDSHIIEANPLRFHRGNLKIAPDDRWRSAQSPAMRWVTTLLTLPLLRAYQYSLRA